MKIVAIAVSFAVSAAANPCEACIADTGKPYEVPFEKCHPSEPFGTCLVSFSDETAYLCYDANDESKTTGISHCAAPTESFCRSTLLCSYPGHPVTTTTTTATAANPCEACIADTGKPYEVPFEKCHPSEPFGTCLVSFSDETAYLCYDANDESKTTGISHCAAPTERFCRSTLLCSYPGHPVNQEAPLASVSTQDLDATSTLFLTPDPTEIGLLEQPEGAHAAGTAENERLEPRKMMVGFGGFLIGASVVGLAIGLKKRAQPFSEESLLA